MSTPVQSVACVALVGIVYGECKKTAVTSSPPSPFLDLWMLSQVELVWCSHNHISQNDKVAGSPLTSAPRHRHPMPQTAGNKNAQYHCDCV
jgi:hypothetical protein